MGRDQFELLNDVSTVKDKLPYKTGAEVCGGVVDRKSGKGMVTITGRGFITLTIRTGPNETGDRYQEISIQPKQTCMIHGEAVVLYYRRRGPPPPPLPTIMPLQQQLQRAEETSMSPSAGSASAFDIVIRVQIYGTGKFSTP